MLLCLGVCTVPTSSMFGSVRLCSVLVPFLVYDYLPWHGHVLPGTQDKFNDWGGGDVTYLSPFWEGTARK